jgi:hypothetical protein
MSSKTVTPVIKPLPERVFLAPLKKFAPIPDLLLTQKD